MAGRRPAGGAEPPDLELDGAEPPDDPAAVAERARPLAIRDPGPLVRGLQGRWVHYEGFSMKERRAKSAGVGLGLRGLTAMEIVRAGERPAAADAAAALAQEEQFVRHPARHSEP